ncbi:MAG TPA: ABC transporter substrate-binding protein, partial [Chloroflexota bacterium]
DDYFLGRPKLDQIIVKFIPDGNTMLANLLSGEIDANVGRGLTLDQADQLNERWMDGKVQYNLTAPIHIWPEMDARWSNPPAIRDVRFRRALLMAINRQELIETFTGGRSKIAATAWLSPGDAEFPAVEKSIVQYAFDPRQSVQLFADAGFSRGVDGLFRDAWGAVVSPEIRTSTRVNETLSIVDYWKQVGIKAQPYTIPRQLAQDLEYRTQFTGFEVIRSPIQPRTITSGELRTPETKYVGANYANYSNADYDALAARYYAAIARPDRVQAENDIMNWLSDQLIDLPLMYDTEPIAAKNRLSGLGPRYGGVTVRGASNVWNAQDWDLTS